MVDITAKLFWYRSKEWYGIMADKLTEIVYTDESKETIDVINLLLIGWILLGLIVYILGNVIASYLRKCKLRRANLKPETAADDKPLNAELQVTCAEENVKTKDGTLTLAEQNTIFFAIPVCEGDEEFKNWIDNVFSWIYKQRVVSPIIDSWLTSLNARTRLSSTEHGILVDFKDLSHSTNPPKITELRQSTNSRYDTNLTCQMDLDDVTFEITVTQFKGKEKTVTPFLLKLQRISGKVIVECCPEDVSFIAKYSETPQIELWSEVERSHKVPSEEDCQPLCDLVSEIGCEALCTAIVPLRFSCFPACPRPLSNSQTEIKAIEDDEGGSDKKLLVKIIKASNLGGKKGCLKPYCVVEIDEPAQRFETEVVDGGACDPFWDEGCTFDVKDSAELLFEIYDKGKSSTENFLGLGIVGVGELLRNPCPRQTIPLQSRPLEEDGVTGTLTAEFMFTSFKSSVVPAPTDSGKEWSNGESESSPSGKTVETNSRVTAGGTVITTTTIKRTKEDIQADVPGTALKELGKHGTSPNATSKSTLIIHSVQRESPQHKIKVSKDGGHWQEVGEHGNSTMEDLGSSPASHLSKDSNTSYPESIPSTPSPNRLTEERSRPKEKKSFMGNLRRKLSFHKARSKSAEHRSESASNYSRASSRSASTDRGRQSSAQKLSPFKANLLGGRFLSVPADSTRSSLSELSGVSGLSTRTYTNENSTLVIETNENGIIKRYLIPNSVAHHSKWKKKGTKLHIFNDHVFIAKHLAGSTYCLVCQKHLTRRPGKQGYECRGCNLQCHKSCHVKVDNYCSNSSINSMEVEYIHDPKGASPKSI